MAPLLRTLGQVSYSKLEELEQILSVGPLLEPALFIFHISRCGSTLTARALSLNPANRVFNEPTVISQPLFWDKLPSEVQSHVFRCHGLVPESGREQRLIIKFAPFALFRLPRILELFPNVEKWFVFRDPLPVLVSNLLRKASFLDPKRTEEIAWTLGEDPADLSAMREPAFAAHILGRQAEVAARHLNEFDRVLNYRDFPGTLIDGCQQWWDEVPPGVEHTLSRYAKDTSRPFVPDEESKIQAATEEMRSACSEYCDSAWQMLESAIRERLRIARPAP